MKCEYFFNSLNKMRNFRPISLEDRVIIHAPLLAFLALVLVLGLPLNALVFYVYTAKLQARTFGMFVKFLVMYDIIYCSVMVPFIMTFTLLPEYFDPEPTCDFLAFSVLYSLVTGGIILIAIAIQRQRSICHLGMKPMDMVRARSLCFVTPFIGVVLALPVAFAVDSETVNVILTARTINITTYTCRLQRFSETVLSQIVIAIIFAEVVIICVTLVAMYGRIWMTIKQQITLNANCNTTTRSRILETSKTSTKMFVVLSLVYCFTHLPATVFLVISSQFDDLDEGRYWSIGVRTLVDIAVYVNLINSVANPIVYGIWCRAFREECKKMFQLQSSSKDQGQVERHLAGSSSTSDTN